MLLLQRAPLRMPHHGLYFCHPSAVYRPSVHMSRVEPILSVMRGHESRKEGRLLERLLRFIEYYKFGREALSCIACQPAYSFVAAMLITPLGRRRGGYIPVNSLEGVVDYCSNATYLSGEVLSAAAQHSAFRANNAGCDPPSSLESGPNARH
jgi:hypothetical protein